MTAMVRIQILYFAYFREKIGLQEEWLQLPASSNVGQALDRLGERHSCVAAARGKFRTAQNQEMVAEQAVLADGDVLALIPPVAGGSDDGYVRVLDEELSVQRVIAAVQGPSVGGIVTFIGQVRDFNDGHSVVKLQYEAYEEMAVKVMRELCEGICAQYEDTVVLAVEHRVGDLDIGDAAVVIAAGAPHRREAFSACQALIDQLKEEVPIWKKETAPDGQEWIGMGP